MIAAAFLTIALLANGAAAQAGADGVWKARYTTSEKRSSRVHPDDQDQRWRDLGHGVEPARLGPHHQGDDQRPRLTFIVTRRANYDEIDVTFTGTIDGDVMKLRMQVAGREAVSMTARREAGTADVR